MTPCLHLHILASGSKGNAALVEGPQGMLLVDCGISRKQLLLRAGELGLDMDHVLATLVTHEHSDHVAGLSVWCNRWEGALYATAGTAGARKHLARLPFTLIGREESFCVGGIEVTTFPTSHDVAEPCGFRFSCGDDAIGWCTDTGLLTPRALEQLAGARILGLESNHDVKMLKQGPYPAYLKARILSAQGHLSNDQAAEALPELVGPDTETVVALHISQENNQPSLAVRTLAEALGAEAANATFTEARTPDGRVSVIAAGQDRPLSVW